MEESSFEEDGIHEVKRGNSRIARGAFGEITLGLDVGRRRLVAVKTFLPTENGLFDEVSALRELGDHDNICQLRALYTKRHGFGAGTLKCLAIEYSPVDLFIALEYRRRKYLPSLDMEVVRRVSLDIFQGLSHVHHHNILHADIKPGNLLISGTGIVKICDFGLSKKIPSDAKTRDKALCTLPYRPPELLFGGDATNFSIDVYSAGCVVAELIQGRTIFDGRNLFDQVERVFSFLGTPTEQHWPEAEAMRDYGKIPLRPRDPQSWETILPRCTESEGLESFLLSTVALDPKLRISSSAATNHPWLKPPIKAHEDTRDELVPAALSDILILSPPTKPGGENDWKVADDQILDLAAIRRGILSSLEPWGKK